MNIDECDIIEDKLNTKSKAVSKWKCFWTFIKQKFRGVYHLILKYFLLANEEYHTFKTHEINKKMYQYNVLNLYEVKRSEPFVNGTKWILEQCKLHIGPTPKSKPEKELIEKALKALHRQRLLIAFDRLYYRSPKTQPPPRIATQWNAPRAIVCHCPGHDCQCILRKTIYSNAKRIPKGKRFFHVPFTKVSPPPGLILNSLSDRIKERMQHYNSPEGQKEMTKLGVEICMAGCLSYMASGVVVDEKDRAALKELDILTKKKKKKKQQLDNARPKKKKVKTDENIGDAKSVAEADSGSKEGVDPDGKMGAAEPNIDSGVKTEENLAEVAKKKESEAKVPKAIVICNMFYNTVATQTERDENDELVIGEYLHVIYACPEDTTLCDIEGMKVEIKPHDPNDPYVSNMERLFHVNELKEHISKIKSVLYDPVFEVVQEKLNQRSSCCGSVSLDDFYKSIDDVKSECKCSSINIESSKASLDDVKEEINKTKVYLPWISLEKLSRLRDSFLKYIRGDIINEDIVDMEPDRYKDCLPADSVTEDHLKQIKTKGESDNEKVIKMDNDILEDENKNNLIKNCKCCISCNKNTAVIEPEQRISKSNKVNTLTVNNNDTINAVPEVKVAHSDDVGNENTIYKNNNSKISISERNCKRSIKENSNKKQSQSTNDMKKIPSAKLSTKLFSVSFGEFKEKQFKRDPWRPCVPSESEILYKNEVKRRREKSGTACECEEEDTCWKTRKPEITSKADIQNETPSNFSNRGILKKASESKSESKFDDSKLVGYCSDAADLKNSSELEMFNHNKGNINSGFKYFSSSKTLMRLAIHKLKMW